MINITLELNRICNLSCTYCYLGDKTNEVMSEIIAKSSVDFAIKKIIVQNHVNRVINIDFLGGEPLLSFYLIKKIFTYCKTKKDVEFTYTITTNGTILDEQIIRFLSDNRHINLFKYLMY